jgi:hypothetical protein
VNIILSYKILEGKLETIKLNKNKFKEIKNNNKFKFYGINLPTTMDYAS